MTGRTNSAAPVAEGALKPASDLAFELETSPVRTLAHYIICSRQILDDAPQLRATVDSELIWGLKYVEEQQLLAGDGSGQNLHGMLPQSTVFSSPITIPTPTAVDTIAAALAQVAIAGYLPDGIIVSMADWLKMATLKDDTGRYLLGEPAASAPLQLFGLPVAATNSIPVGTFLVGAFKQAAIIWDRMSVVILVSTETGDAFVKNLVYVLCEERLGFSVVAPLGLVKGTLPA